MLDAPPLENIRSSLYDRPNSLSRSESLVTSAHLPRQASATLDLNSSQPSDFNDSRATAGLEASPSHRQLSGNMASTSYLRPVQVNNQQPVSSSTSQPPASYVIELDDDSPLPMRHQQHSNMFSSSRHQHSSLQQHKSANLVDLTGSPPVTRLPIRQPSNRIDLDSIGSGSLRRSSSDLGNQQTRNTRLQQQHQQQAQRSRPEHRAGDSVSSHSLYGNMGALQPGRLRSCAADSSGALNSMFSHEAGDFLDISGLQSSPRARNSSSSSLQPTHRSSIATSRGHGVPMNEQRSALVCIKHALITKTSLAIYAAAPATRCTCDKCCCLDMSHADLQRFVSPFMIFCSVGRATRNGTTNFNAWADAATQEDMDLALGELQLPLS